MTSSPERNGKNLYPDLLDTESSTNIVECLMEEQEDPDLFLNPVRSNISERISPTRCLTVPIKTKSSPINTVRSRSMGASQQNKTFNHFKSSIPTEDATICGDSSTDDDEADSSLMGKIDDCIENNGKNIFLVCAILFFVCLLSMFYNGNVHKSPRYQFREEFGRILSEYELTDEANFVILSKIGAWSMGRQSDPLVIVIAGKEKTRREFINSLYSAAVKSRGLSYDGVITCDDSINRARLHAIFEDRLAKEKPSIVAFENSEKLIWDAPVPMHAFGDDESSPTPKALILLGVNFHAQDPKNCDSEVQLFLLEKWTQNGGHFDGITPIVNSRIDYFICI